MMNKMIIWVIMFVLFGIMAENPKNIRRGNDRVIIKAGSVK
jgi:hypothetical protein